MTHWLIQSNEGDPLPSYFSKKIARALGSQLGWTSRKHEATTFESEEAAAAFADRQIAHVRTLLVKAE